MAETARSPMAGSMPGKPPHSKYSLNTSPGPLPLPLSSMYSLNERGSIFTST
ncbi:hypothetical protein PAA26_04245 [Methanomassiliicoccaceae archaeon COG_1]|nr:hypothetical protein [Methanomassiliicoccaceae archaeon COG_1]